MVRLLAPLTGPQCVGMLCVAWEEPEMREFYAAAPQLGRILRPLAFMIGAPVPEWLRLPRRVRVRVAHPSPRLWSASRPKPSRRGGEEAAGESGVERAAADVWVAEVADPAGPAVLREFVQLPAAR